MDSQKDKKHFLKNKNTDNREVFIHSNDDAIVFVPAENIRAIKQVIDRWEEVKQRWDKMVK